MNKIVIEDGQLKNKLNSKQVVIDYHEAKEDFDINSLVIDVIASTKLELSYASIKESKINITFNIKEGVELNLFELNTKSKSKVKAVYNLESNSCLNAFKFNNCDGWRELDLINLNGRNSTINYYLKTIAKLDEKYDILFYHRASDTKANVYCHGISMDHGNLIFNVTNTVCQGMHNANINQNSRIITLNNNKCQINPNLLIDEYDVSANHSAIIGKFNEAEIFYLTSRGISYNQALSLLIKGFLLNGFNINIFNKDILTQIIDKYWR